MIEKQTLFEAFPDIASEWDYEANQKLKFTPHTVTPGSDKKVGWRCPKGEDHIWEARIDHRTRAGSGCTICSNRKIVPSNSLRTKHSYLAEQWHPTKNAPLTPDNVGANTSKKVYWMCNKGHEWDALIGNRARKGYGCPECSGQKTTLSNCLATTHPEMVIQWHPTENTKTPYDVSAGSNEEVWWTCLKSEQHKPWKASVVNRIARNSGCPRCANQLIDETNCLATTHPEIAVQWHPEKNKNLKIYPHTISAGNHNKVWWKCSTGADHEWQALISNRTRGQGCAVCANRQITASNCLLTHYPDIAKEWHPTKNNSLTPESVSYGSSQSIWWQCSNDPEHPPWSTKVVKRTRNKTGCPSCNLGWTLENVKIFVRSLLPNITSFTPAELFVIFQQNGITSCRGKSATFVKAMQSGKFPQEELEKFVNGQPSVVDAFIASAEDSDNAMPLDEKLILLSESTSSDGEALPVIETQDVLKTLENQLIANIDEEAVEFFIHSAIAKIWRHAFSSEKNEEIALKQLDAYIHGTYSLSVKEQFLLQYHGAKNVVIPNGYKFSVDGHLSLPNLMQRYTAYLVQTKKRIGNWSGTGAGKTLSAVLSSRVIDAKLTIICCPNSVTSRWEDGIKEIYPDSAVWIKNFDLSSCGQIHQYLILNYEFFQQPCAERQLKKLLASHTVDFVVIDEIHHSKQRIAENISKRKKVISAMLSEAYQTNNALHVLGMSATPVINNLFEGKTLIELITGISHDELNTAPTISNCISLYQKLVLNGIRWVPEYSQKLHVQTIEVDCSAWIEDVRKLGLQSTMVELEGVLTLAKIPEILVNIKPKTIIYTHFLKNIILPLKNAVESGGWRVTIYSGDDKTGLKSFLSGNTDVLIATSCISTGIDGLQSVCNRIIVNTLPWTHAEFEQLKGRVYRQGQVQDHVDIIVPLTFAYINGERWSWCDSRWKRIQFKKSISDAAVDGVIPEGQLRTPAQAYQDTMSWLKRLESGQLNEIQRERISLSLSEEALRSGLRRFGDFSKMNRLINMTSSSVMHEKFKQDPSQWEFYHTLYREARKEWPIVPFEEAIKWCKLHPYFVIGDFGCGEALLASSIENTVYSFDHVAINDKVIACDMAHVPLEDESLDVAIFSLSLMGSNYIDYISEAHRCLKFDGQLWIAETTSRFENLSLLKEQISNIGFNVLSIDQKGSFTFLRAFKNW